MTYVIATVSTTDFNGRDPVQTYDIFLMRPEKRVNAWWSPMSMDAERFETREAAQATYDRLFPAGDPSRVKEIVEGWRPASFGADPETYKISWYVQRGPVTSGPFETREAARAEARRLNAALQVETGATLY